MACPVLFTITTLPVMDVPAAMMRDGSKILADSGAFGFALASRFDRAWSWSISLW